MSAGNAPTFTVEAFPLRAAVWANEHVGNGGRTFQSYSIKFTRAYKDQTGKWQSTEAMTDRELPILAILSMEVYRRLVVKDGRSPGSVAPAAAETEAQPQPSEPAPW